MKMDCLNIGLREQLGRRHRVNKYKKHFSSSFISKLKKELRFTTNKTVYADAVTLSMCIQMFSNVYSALFLQNSNSYIQHQILSFKTENR